MSNQRAQLAAEEIVALDLECWNQPRAKDIYAAIISKHCIEKPLPEAKAGDAAKLREALEYYAQPELYTNHWNAGERVLLDRGHRAKSALASTPETRKSQPETRKPAETVNERLLKAAKAFSNHQHYESGRELRDAIRAAESLPKTMEGELAEALKEMLLRFESHLNDGTERPWCSGESADRRSAIVNARATITKFDAKTGGGK